MTKHRDRTVSRPLVARVQTRATSARMRTSARTCRRHTTDDSSCDLLQPAVPSPTRPPSPCGRWTSNRRSPARSKAKRMSRPTRMTLLRAARGARTGFPRRHRMPRTSATGLARRPRSDPRPAVSLPRPFSRAHEVHHRRARFAIPTCSACVLGVKRATVIPRPYCTVTRSNRRSD